MHSVEIPCSNQSKIIHLADHVFRLHFLFSLFPNSQFSLEIFLDNNVETVGFLPNKRRLFECIFCLSIKQQSLVSCWKSHLQKFLGSWLFVKLEHYRKMTFSNKNVHLCSCRKTKCEHRRRTDKATKCTKWQYFTRMEKWNNYRIEQSIGENIMIFIAHNSFTLQNVEWFGVFSLSWFWWRYVLSSSADSVLFVPKKVELKCQREWKWRQMDAELNCNSTRNFS